jgi:hypothetical protein
MMTLNSSLLVQVRELRMPRPLTAEEQAVAEQSVVRRQLWWSLAEPTARLDLKSKEEVKKLWKFEKISKLILFRGCLQKKLFL